MELVDTKYFDVVIEGGVVKVQLPIVAVLKELAKKSDNSIDDAIVELVEKALEAK